jgi:alpha-galactosidase
LDFCQNAVKTYNSIKQIIWQGDQYRLSDPVSNSVASVMFVDPSKKTGVVFNYLVNYRYGAGSKLPIRLKGLDAAKKYKLREINLYPGTGSDVQGDKVYTGDFLMNIGINPVINTSRTSVVLKLEESR